MEKANIPMSPLVSILIPAYNAGEWIEETVKSAIGQDWPNKEIIIVDDGSTDDTLRIAKQFESKYIKVFTQKNRGASAARNKALSIAQGDYIQWLDADDLLAPDKISVQIKKGNIAPEDRVLLSCAWGKFYYRKERAKFVPNCLWQNLEPVEWLLRKYNKNLWMNPAVWLVGRKLSDLTGPWDERLSLDDDGEYFTRAVAACKVIKFVNGAKSYYRVGNERSLSHSVSEKALLSLFLSISLNIKYMRQLEDTERTRSACLKYLQTWLSYFYPEQKEILIKANSIAEELGGKLVAPDMRWKYLIIRKIFGWKIGKIAERKIPMFKEVIRSNWDKILYKISIG